MNSAKLSPLRSPLIADVPAPSPTKPAAIEPIAAKSVRKKLPIPETETEDTEQTLLHRRVVGNWGGENGRQLNRILKEGPLSPTDTLPLSPFPSPPLITGWGDWFPGYISSVNHDGTVNIQFDDGDFEADVKR